MRERDPSTPGYTIQAGRIDAPRLRRQAEVMGVATRAFLTRTGLGPGWKCVDVGCGVGEVTLDIARAVGPRGQAVGIDTDAQALAIAAAAAEHSGLAARFVRADAAAGLEGQAFDLAFARLLLSHLADPSAVLRAMRDGLRAGGVLAVEDLFTGTLRSDPPSDALKQLQDVYSATVRAHGGDPTIGPRLPALLAAAGLHDVRERTVTNAIDTVEQKLFLVELLEHMHDAILQAGVTSAAELDEITHAVDRIARQPGTVFHQARMHQVWGRRATTA